MIKKLNKLIGWSFVIGIVLILIAIYVMSHNQEEFKILDTMDLFTLTMFASLTGCGILMFSIGLVVGSDIGKNNR